MLYRFTGFTKLKPAHPLLFVSFEGEEGNSLVNDSVTKLSDSSLNQKNLGVNKKFDLMQNIELKHWHSTDVYVTFKIK